MVRLSRREHHDAQQPTSHLLVPGPSNIHPLRIIPEHISTRPEIVLADGNTLIQPRLPAMLRGIVQQAHVDADSYDDRDIIAPDRLPLPDPEQHGRKRATQWQRWQTEVLPALLVPYAHVLHETKLLQDYDTLEIPRKSCACVGRALKIAVVRFTSIDDITLNVCPCHPTAVQLIKAGAFACAPVSPWLVVDLRVLEFTRSLFIQIAPNNTAFAFTLETVLANMGFQLDHKNSLRRRFGNSLMWYSHLRNLHKQRYETPPPEDAEERARAAARAELPPDRSSLPSLLSSTHRAPPAGRKWNRSPTLEPPPVPVSPFPEPVPCAQPSEYLRARCPACFSDLKHDGNSTSDVKMHPRTRFVPEQQTAATEAYVDGVRNAGRTKSKRCKIDNPNLPLPWSVLDGCEASFKAADEKWEKASTEFFEDTGIIVLLCRDDRVLWIINMHSAGEKQFNVIALMETLFQHLPLDIAVGVLYDVACAMERACRKWGFLGRFIDRLSFTVSVFHAYGHEWACQILFHPRKHGGFGFTNGEGCEHLWHSISHLIAQLHISGNGFSAVTDIAEKHREATQVLVDSGKPVSLLRKQWAFQVLAQTKPVQRRSKNRSQQVVNAVVLLRAAVKTRQQNVQYARDRFLEAVDEDTLHKAQKNLRLKEQELGVDQHQALKKLSTNGYIGLRMKARTLKRRLRDRLRAWRFELDKVEQSFRRLVNGTYQKLYTHTEAAVKRREPTITKINSQYNKLCGEIRQAIKDGKAPPGAVAPATISSKELWQLDIDDGIWQDVGLDDDWEDNKDDEHGEGEPPLWLSNEKVRTGIKAMLELDRCNEEDGFLKKERCALQVWFAEEWTVVNCAIDEEDQYQLELVWDHLIKLCATWQKSLPDLGVDEAALPPWGLSAVQLSTCIVDAHLPAWGEDRHYRGSGDLSDDEEEEEFPEGGGEEEDYGTLEAVERADLKKPMPRLSSPLLLESLVYAGGPKLHLIAEEAEREKHNALAASLQDEAMD
ncbi:hypothetical protein DFH07DRAFT_962422 [Mycena maculata]|uniref:CxC1-like cysteine cluster associated with KDZ transposases domain-containing protein n=1 Tax=Mycena maculata TaxID=230809 RepID=A0AAD7N6M4_9AGAR|nr:hypothetical protein DFH07DRAFT_962422 [Mycena maculata]